MVMSIATSEGWPATNGANENRLMVMGFATGGRTKYQAKPHPAAIAIVETIR
jgi:hypothetical protein